MDNIAFYVARVPLRIFGFGSTDGIAQRFSSRHLPSGHSAKFVNDAAHYEVPWPLARWL